MDHRSFFEKHTFFTSRPFRFSSDLVQYLPGPFSGQKMLEDPKFDIPHMPVEKMGEAGIKLFEYGSRAVDDANQLAQIRDVIESRGMEIVFNNLASDVEIVLGDTKVQVGQNTRGEFVILSSSTDTDEVQEILEETVGQLSLSTDQFLNFVREHLPPVTTENNTSYGDIFMFRTEDDAFVFDEASRLERPREKYCVTIALDASKSGLFNPSNHPILEVLLAESTATLEETLDFFEFVFSNFHNSLLLLRKDSLRGEIVFALNPSDEVTIVSRTTPNFERVLFQQGAGYKMLPVMEKFRVWRPLCAELYRGYTTGDLIRHARYDFYEKCVSFDISPDEEEMGTMVQWMFRAEAFIDACYPEAINFFHLKSIQGTPMCEHFKEMEEEEEEEDEE